MSVLAKLKILELASVLAGPGVGQFFAELGADVIKIENLLTGGDVTRSWKTATEATDDRSAYFCSVNWGKKSLAVDLTKVEGQKIVHDLVKISDVVIASYKPGDAEKLNVDYHTLKSIRPDIIYGQITGYGPGNSRVGYDAIIQAEAGFMSMNGVKGGDSLKMPVALMDVLAGHHLKEALLVALLERLKTGNGSLVEVSLIDAAIASLVNQASNWLVGRHLPTKQGSEHPNIAPYGDVFETQNGKEILFAIGNDKQFKELCAVLEIPAVFPDNRFQTNVNRVKNRHALKEILRPKIGRWSSEELMKKLNALKIPAGIIQNVQEVFSTELGKGMTFSSAGITGVRSFAGRGSLFSDFSSHFIPPPHIGEHTTEILRNSLNYSSETLEMLKNASVIK